MRVSGYLHPEHEPAAPFVKALVVSPPLGITRVVDFLVDTGASVSMVLDRDAERLGLDPSVLKEAPRRIHGIGGQVDTFLVEDAQLVFRREDGSLVAERLELYVGRHDLAHSTEEEKRRILGLPSLLGRDILCRYCLVFDKVGGEVYLERDR